MYKFGTRLIWNTQPEKTKEQTTSQIAEQTGQKPDLGTILNPNRNVDLLKQRTDLKEFYEELRLQKARDINGETEKKLHEFDLQKNVEALRTAGVSESENQQNYRKKHVLLSSAFLEETGAGTLTVNFKKNNEAEWKVGLGDMLPPTVKAISIERGIDPSGVKQPNVDRAIRSQNPATHRIGYFLESALKEQPPRYEYAYVHTGDNVIILETRAAGKDLDDEFKKEHDQIYKFGSAKDGVYEPHEVAPSVNPLSPGAAPVHAQTAKEIGQIKTGLPGSPKAKTGVEKPNQPGGSNESLPGNAAIAAMAERYLSDPEKIRKIANDFRNLDHLKDGRIGCGRVASSILMDAGYIDQYVDGAGTLANALIKRGWRKQPSSISPLPGYVVVWNSTQTDSGMREHIGIVADPPTMAIDNNSKKAGGPGPDKRPLQRERGIAYFLVPPGSATPISSGNREPKTANTAPQTAGARQPDIGQRSAAAGSAEAPKIKLDKNAERVESYASLIKAASAKWGVDEYLIRGVIDQESGGIPDIANAKCGGLMALMDSTARHYGLKTLPSVPNGKYYKLVPGDERADPAKCIDAGTHMLKDLLNQHGGNIQAALAAYNWGPGNYQKWVKNGSDPARMPAETRNYITKIPAKMAAYQARNTGNSAVV